MAYTSLHVKAQAGFDPAPSIGLAGKSNFRAVAAIPKEATCVGALLAEEGEVPAEFGVDRAALKAAGYTGKVGQVLIVPRKNAPVVVFVGMGARGKFDANVARDAAAVFARASIEHANVALVSSDLPSNPAACTAWGQAFAEGVILGRYRYTPLKHSASQNVKGVALSVVANASIVEPIQRGLDRGGITGRAAELARDLANAPAALLSAKRMADVAVSIGKTTGLEVEVFDEERLSALGCGGILGVNAGSAEPPRLIKLTYRPAKSNGTSGRVALVAKGIMYDSGGIALKPGDDIHAQMKNDMSGAGAVLAAMTALKAMDCPHTVTGFLMCTDNMPSGTAMKLGDVLTVRGGKTVEVINTDAEGRLIMSDGLVLATELDPKPDAIVDIATLTGQAMRTFGVLTAAIMSNQPSLVEQLRQSGERTDESVWELPLDRRMREELDSTVADIKNMAGANGGSITAGLFLEDFVAGIPWAHVDMCGPAHSPVDRTWRSKGMTGYGARLLIDFLVNFRRPEVH